VRVSTYPGNISWDFAGLSQGWTPVATRRPIRRRRPRIIRGVIAVLPSLIAAAVIQVACGAAAPRPKAANLESAFTTCAT